MAKFKNQDLLLDDNEQILLGDDDDASIYWDGSDLITNQLLKHSSQGYYATREFVESTVAALEWQDSVLSKSYSIPPTANDGDRYIVKASGIGDWLGHDDEIAELNTTWGFTTPSAGFACWVEDEGVYYIWNGSAWIKFGGVVDHGNLLGLSDDDHTQYVLVDGSRAMTGQLKIDSGASPTVPLHLFVSAAASHELHPWTNLLIEDNDHSVLQFVCAGGGNKTQGITFGDSDADAGALLYDHSSNLMTFRAAGQGVLYIDFTTGLRVYDTSNNTKMSMGITINQGANDDEILAFKSSDVAHGVTALAETDTYAAFAKAHPDQGGLKLTTGTETGGYRGFVTVNVVTDEDTTKSTAAEAPILLTAYKKSGTGSAAMSSNANIIGIRDASSTRWLLSKEGHMHLDGDIMPFDADTQNIGASGSEWDEIYCNTLIATTISGSWDHGQLTGLSDDDHPIYLPTDGSRGMTGTLSVGTTGGYIKFSGTSADIGFATDTDLLTLETGVAPSATINGGLVTTSSIFINDTECNDVTTGLVINQGAANDQLIALKASGVTHGMTDIVETDTFGALDQITAGGGGLLIDTFAEDVLACYIRASGINDNTTKTSAAVAPIILAAYKRSGTNISNPGADANLVVIRKGVTGVWLADEDGDTHQNGDIMPFNDASQDIGALNYMWGNIYTDALTVSSGNITMYGDILPATSDTYDLGHSDAVWDNIWCKTLHSSAGTINLGSIALTDSSGELLVDGTAVPSLSTTQAASANAVSVAETYSNSASANAYTKSAAYTDTQVGATGVNKGYTSGSIGAVVSKNYTGISEDAVQINIYYRNVSNNNASNAPIIQLYNQSTAQTTGYEGHVMTGGSNDRNDTDGIHYCNTTADHAASDVYDGQLIINRMNSAGTIWAWQGTSIADVESSFRNCTGYVTLSTAFGGTVRFTSEGGGATHDGGTVYISWF